MLSLRYCLALPKRHQATSQRILPSEAPSPPGARKSRATTLVAIT